MKLSTFVTLTLPVLLSGNAVMSNPTFCGFASEETFTPQVKKYIEDYHEMAIVEMERTNVPASITLAQGMLESGFGTSALASNANNHFGIKCHKGWTGETYIHESGENFNGSFVKIKSCFRSYTSVEESFQDHSDFLSTRSNYAFLFQGKRLDYKGWAEGLLKAGYATDPRYATKLISTIENYDLARFDKYTNTVLASNPIVEDQGSNEELDILKFKIQTLESILQKSELYKAELKELLKSKDQKVIDLQDQHGKITQELNAKIGLLDNTLALQSDVINKLHDQLNSLADLQKNMLSTDPLSDYFNPDGTVKEKVTIFPVRKLDSKGVFYQSGIKATIITANRNLIQIANEYGVELTELLIYNDLISYTDLPIGTYVYLEPKANYYKSGRELHQVVMGETIHDISQLYGIKLSKLYRRNQMKKGE